MLFFWLERILKAYSSSAKAWTHKLRYIGNQALVTHRWIDIWWKLLMINLRLPQFQESGIDSFAMAIDLAGVLSWSIIQDLSFLQPESEVRYVGLKLVRYFSDISRFEINTISHWMEIYSEPETIHKCISITVFFLLFQTLYISNPKVVQGLFLRKRSSKALFASAVVSGEIIFMLRLYFRFDIILS